jgi:hypothetical protein
LLDICVKPCTGISAFKGKKEGKMAMSIMPPPMPTTPAIVEVIIEIKKSVSSNIMVLNPKINLRIITSV